MRTINVNRANDSLVIMYPATMGHAQCLAEYFGVPFTIEPSVDENGKIEYSISFRSDNKKEVDSINDFMNVMASEEIHPLVGELQQLQASLVNRVNFSVIKDVSEFDMEDFDKGSFALDAVIRNASALKRTLLLIRESIETVIANEEIK